MSDRARILVADDEPNLCRVMVARLDRDGYLAEAVHDGSQVLERLRAEAFDLVFLDLRMPALSGMEVLGEIRRLYPDIAVIVMTAYDSPDTVDAVMAAGADAYLTKPFDLDAASEAVLRVLPHRGMEMPGEARAPS